MNQLIYGDGTIICAAEEGQVTVSHLCARRDGDVSPIVWVFRVKIHGVLVGEIPSDVDPLTYRSIQTAMRGGPALTCHVALTALVSTMSALTLRRLLELTFIQGAKSVPPAEDSAGREASTK